MIKKKKAVPENLKGLDFKSFKKEALKDEKCKAEYEALSSEFEILEQFILARKKAKISQVELAKRLKSQQPAVARLENGGYANTSIASLNKVANALGYSLHFSLKQAQEQDFLSKPRC